MANVNRQWKRWMAVGCRHGLYADRDALDKVLEFQRKYKPHTRIDLGDATDQAAFRTGAHGTKDETVSIKDDLTAGLSFEREYRPTHKLNGNHEIRLWKLADHHNEIIARAASSVIQEMLDLAQKQKTQYVTEYDINSSWLTLGDTKFLHGFMFNEMAIRDHAEHFGNCVIAHLHKAGQATGRRSDHPTAWCVGTLAHIPAMAYANTRRSTAAWSHGFAWGEYSDNYCHVNLSQCPQNQARNWKLPL